MSLNTSGTYYAGDNEIEYSFTYAPARAAVMHLPNGDPGYPAEDEEPEEWEISFNGKPFDPDGLYIKQGKKYVELFDAIFNYAMENR